MKRSAHPKYVPSSRRHCGDHAYARRAREMGVDLILIEPTAEPPVAKAMDDGQWEYENKKKQHEGKKK